VGWNFELLAVPAGDPIEGLAWDGEAMLLSRPEVDLIQRYTPRDGQFGVLRRYTNHTSGLAFAPSGELYGCQQLSRRIVRFNRNGSTTPMTYRFRDGSYHNMPRHLSIDQRGRIWFSDPVHRLPASGPPAPFVGHQSVLRLDQRADRSWSLDRLTYDTTSPSGVAVSPDQSTLYVADDTEANAELRAYPILADGTLGQYRLLHSFGRDYRGKHRGADGLCVDTTGALIACAGSPDNGPGALLYVFSREGRLVTTQPLPAGVPTVCAFGDEGLASLYVGTAEGHLFRAHNTSLPGPA
jgi:gluconolactonase